MAFNISEAFADLKPKGPIRTMITEIELHQIDPNPQNFYSMEGIADLAENIRMFGLMEPLIVKPSVGEHYMLISGHRRREALILLANEGYFEDGFHHKVDCIIHEGPVNLPGIESLEKQEAAVRIYEQLQLIFANSGTREMSSSDKAMQVKQTRELLTELKRLGYKLPGRMRDLIAETANVSAARVGRLDVIEKNLKDRWLRTAWKDGDLQESSAYEIARRDPEIQKLVSDRVGVDALCEMKTEDVIVCLDGCEADGNRKRPEAKNVSKMDTKPEAPAKPAAPAPEARSTEELVASYRAASDMEDDILRDICRRNLGAILREIMWNKDHDFSTCFRLPNIDAMKKHSGSYSPSWSGVHEDLQWDSRGVRVRKHVEKDDGRAWVCFSRSWTDFYDALSGAAMEQARKKQKNVTKMDTNLPAAGWQTGEPAEPGEYIVLYGISEKEDPKTRGYKLMAWNGIEFVNPRSGVANLEGMTIYRWIRIPEV